MKTWPNQIAAANRRPAGQSDGSGNLFATAATGPVCPAAVAESGSSATRDVSGSIASSGVTA